MIIKRFKCGACNCNSPKSSHYILDHEYCLKNLTLYQECDDCGSLSQSPMPSDKKLQKFYPKSYHSFSGNGILTRIRLWMRFIRIRDYLNKDDNLLDYGCGDGNFIYFAAKRLPSNKFFGYEISSNNKIIKKKNVIIIKGNTKFLFKNLPKFKVITMNHTIEHLPKPKEIIKKLYRKLDYAGFIEGQTPATKSFEKFLFKGYWSGFHAPRHTVIFSVMGLKRIFLKIGFKNVFVQSGFNPASYAVSIGSITKKKTKILKRNGIKWLILVFIGGIFSFIDIFIKRPNIINFKAFKSIGL